MKHKFIKITTTALAALMAVTGCNKKIDEAFTNPNATVRVPVETILPGLIGNMTGNASGAGSGYGTANDALYIGRYVQYWGTNTANNQFDQMGGATGGSDILGGVWASHYYGMGQNLNRMIEWAAEEKKWDYVGVGYALRSWSWLMLTDIYGEAILREAFNTSLLTFKYDTQEDIYAEVKRTAKLAIENLDKTGDNVSQANLAKGDAFFYNGDVNKWKRFVYATLARLYNRTTNKASYKPDSVIYYTDLAMQTNADNAMQKFANTGVTGTSNFFGPVRNNFGALRQGQYIANLVNGTNTLYTGVEDPRAWYILRENNNGTIRGVEPSRGAGTLGANDQPRNFWGGTFGVTLPPALDTGCRFMFKNGSPFPIFTASEMQFLKAEALFRKNDRAGARQAYIRGIDLHFDMLTETYNASVPAARQITPAMKQAFLANTTIVPAANDLTLSHIMTQKYIALFGWGSLETWVDMRRYHYTDVVGGSQVYRDFIPPSGTLLFLNNNGKLVYRCRPRYNSEYIYNVQELDRIGALALDYHTKEQWFSQP